MHGLFRNKSEREVRSILAYEFRRLNYLCYEWIAPPDGKTIDGELLNEFERISKIRDLWTEVLKPSLKNHQPHTHLTFPPILNELQKLTNSIEHPDLRSAAQLLSIIVKTGCKEIEKIWKKQTTNANSS